MSHKVIVYGGKGALGSATVSAFKRLHWWVLAIDLERGVPNLEADSKILITDQNSDSLVAQEKQVCEEAKAILGGKLVCHSHNKY